MSERRSILHISAEFGSNYVGGLGTFVNALVAYQRDSLGIRSDVCEFSDIGEIDAFRLQTEVSDFDLMHIHDWHCVRDFHLRNWWPSTPVVMTCHMPSIFPGYGSSEIDEKSSFFEELLARRSDIVVSNSRYTSRILARRYGVNPEKARVILNGISQSIFYPNLNDRTDTLVVGAGRLVEQKGWPTFIEASRVISKFVPDAQFLVVGSGEQRGRLEQLACELGMHERLRFAGRVDQVTLARIFRKASVVMVPSTYEPLGQVAIEAMACGACVVASRTGGLREIIESGHNGLLVTAGDPKEFAEACVQLLVSKRARQLIRQRAFAEINSSFSIETCAMAYGQAYEDAIDQFHR